MTAFPLAASFIENHTGLWALVALILIPLGFYSAVVTTVPLVRERRNARRNKGSTKLETLAGRLAQKRGAQLDAATAEVGRLLPVRVHMRPGRLQVSVAALYDRLRQGSAVYVTGD